MTRPGSGLSEVVYDLGGVQSDDEDRVWKEFKAELEKEGFSSTVLKQHKVCLDYPFLRRDGIWY